MQTFFVYTRKEVTVEKNLQKKNDSFKRTDCSA